MRVIDFVDPEEFIEDLRQDNVSGPVRIGSFDGVDGHKILRVPYENEFGELMRLSMEFGSRVPGGSGMMVVVSELEKAQMDQFKEHIGGIAKSLGFPVRGGVIQ